MFDLAKLYESALVAQIEHHTEIDSTSSRALVLAADAAVQMPLLVLANQQSAGRGRGSNQWWASRGALTFSLVVDTSAYAIAMQQWPQLSLVTGLALSEALEPLAPRAQFSLKWPNDVYAANHKLGGILIEAVPSQKSRLVIGIGLNINNSLAAAPEEIRQRAVSLFDLLENSASPPFDLTAILLSLLGSLDQHYRQLSQQGFASLLPDWRSRCFLTGKQITIQTGPQSSSSPQITGLCHGLSDDGSLLFSTASGVQSVVAGSVSCWEG